MRGPLRLGIDQTLPADPLFDLYDPTRPPPRLKKRQYHQTKESVDNRVFRIYLEACRDMDIPLSEELEVWEVGRLAIMTASIDDATLAKVLREYAESVRFQP